MHYGMPRRRMLSRWKLCTAALSQSSAAQSACWVLVSELKGERLVPLAAVSLPQSAAGHSGEGMGQSLQVRRSQEACTYCLVHRRAARRDWEGHSVAKGPSGCSREAALSEERQWCRLCRRPCCRSAGASVLPSPQVAPQAWHGTGLQWLDCKFNNPANNNELSIPTPTAMSLLCQPAAAAAAAAAVIALEGQRDARALHRRKRVLLQQQGGGTGRADAVGACTASCRPNKGAQLACRHQRGKGSTPHAVEQATGGRARAGQAHAGRGRRARRERTQPRAHAWM